MGDHQQKATLISKQKKQRQNKNQRDKSLFGVYNSKKAFFKASEPTQTINKRPHS